MSGTCLFGQTYIRLAISPTNHNANIPPAMPSEWPSWIDFKACGAADRAKAIEPIHPVSSRSFAFIGKPQTNEYNVL